MNVDYNEVRFNAGREALSGIKAGVEEGLGFAAAYALFPVVLGYKEANGNYEHFEGLGIIPVMGAIAIDYAILTSLDSLYGSTLMDYVALIPVFLRFGGYALGHALADEQECTKNPSRETI
jgi:hypothetical protein